MVSSLKSSGTDTTPGSEVPAGTVATVVACALDEAIRVAKSAFAAVEAGGALVQQLRGCQLDHDTVASIFELAERQHVDLQMCLGELRQAIQASGGGCALAERPACVAQSSLDGGATQALPEQLEDLQRDASKLWALVKTLRDLNEAAPTDLGALNQRGWIASMAAEQAEQLAQGFNAPLGMLMRGGAQ